MKESIDSRLNFDVKVCTKCRDKNRASRKHIQCVFATKGHAKSKNGTHHGLSCKGNAGVNPKYPMKLCLSYSCITCIFSMRIILY